MSDSIKNNTKAAIMTEATEGTYLTPASGADFISPLNTAFEIKPTKEILKRNNINSSIGETKPRGGMRGVTAQISVEAKANGTAGAYPEYGPLMKSALGNSRQNTTVVTTKTGNTASVLQIQDSDISKFNVGDIILVKKSGAYHVSPITSKSTGTGTATVTLLVAHPSGSLPDSVTVDKFSTYFTANTGHPTISISKYTEDAKLETAYGCRVNAMSLKGFTAGKLADLDFALEGLGFDQSLTAPSYTPIYDSALPPIVLSASVYQDGTALAVNEVSFALDNKIAFRTSTASSNGKIGSRVSARTVKGTIDPYKASDSIAQFTKFNNDTSFSIFGYMAVPTGVAGEFKDVFAFYMPDCFIDTIAEKDQNGLLQESLAFSANRGSTGSTEEIYIGCI